MFWVTVRRLHDTNRSAWWCLLEFVIWPFFYLFMILPSEDENNRFNKAEKVNNKTSFVWDLEDNNFLKHELLFLIGILIFLAPFLSNFFLKTSFLGFNPSITNYIVCGVIALIPTLVWMFIFNKQHHESKITIITAFLAGCTSTVPVLFYKKLFTNGAEGNFLFFKAEAVNFQQNISEVFWYTSTSELKTIADSGGFTALIGVLLLFIGVWVLEEVSKYAVISKKALKYIALLTVVLGLEGIFFKSVSASYVSIGLIFYLIFLVFLYRNIRIKSIDDAIEIAIISALGFAFVENVHYFSSKWEMMSGWMFAFFVFVRVTIVTVVHVLCSGILGYHMGLARFAHPVLQDEMRKNRKNHPVLNFLHKILDTPKEKIFKFEQMFIGLFLAISIHALYDFIMEINSFNLLGSLPLVAIAMPLYLIWGLWYLFRILNKKEDHKEFGNVVSDYD